MKKLSARLWASFILVGLVGQFAWTIENMYFNVYLYNTISTDPNFIAAMVSASAISATLTTLLMGVLTDKVGKRKIFISLGYILWGLSTAAFGFITVDNMAKIFPAASAVTFAAGLVVAMDCIMTFFGSTANDAAFNAFVTDNTTSENRGKAESVLATLPLISMLIIFGVFDGMTQRGEWQKFFLIFGAAVTVTGIVSAFLVKDAEGLAPSKEAYGKKLIHGFRPSVIKSNPMLYIALVAMLIFSIAVQVFFPYLIIYIQNYLKFDNYAIVLGAVLIVASIVSVASGPLMDKMGKLKFTVPACVIMFAGLIAMYFVRSFWAVLIAGMVMMSGYMLVTAAINATVRDYTPSGSVGHFQGVRMIFSVLLPMVIGPYIGAAVIKNSGETYLDLGQVKNVPTPDIFLAAAIALIPVIIPVIVLSVKSRKMAAVKESEGE